MRQRKHATGAHAYWKGGKLGALALAAGLALPGGSAMAGPIITYGDDGYIQFDYQTQMWAQYRDWSFADNDSETLDFFLRRNRFGFHGLFNEYVGYYVNFEVNSEGRQGQSDRPIFYRDAYLTLDYTDSLRFMFGRFKNTFSRENLEACFEPLTLDRSETLAYTPYGGSRDNGVAVWGNLANALVNYRLMVADGRQESEAAEQNPRFTGRVHLSLLDPEWSYGYRGTYLGTQRVLTLGASYDYQENIAYANFGAMEDKEDYEAFTVDAFFEYPFGFGVVTASAAYFDYSVGDAFEGADPDPELHPWSDRDGYYAKAGYMLPGRLGIGRLQFFGRYEEIEYGDGVGLSDFSFASVGLNYYIDGHNLKVTLEHAMVDFDEEDPNFANLQDYNQTTLGLQMMF